jgi:hypothetical protein
VVTPVTTPDVICTVATEVLALLQVPPDVALLSVVVAPGQTVNVPVIAAEVLTVSDLVAVAVPQPLVTA